MKTTLYREAIGKHRMLSVIGMLFCMFLSVSFASVGKDTSNNSPTNVFVDKSVVAFPKIKGTQGVYQLVSHGRPGELLINGEWKNAEIKPSSQSVLK